MGYRRNDSFTRLLNDYPMLNLILVAIGIFAIYGAIVKPEFFWENRKAVRARDILGDDFATVLYILMGAFLIFFGIIQMDVL